MTKRFYIGMMDGYRVNVAVDPHNTEPPESTKPIDMPLMGQQVQMFPVSEAIYQEWLADDEVEATILMGDQPAELEHGAGS